ncbi:Tat pathway signal protein [Streptomyces sp. NPDC053560]|uniref:Tat pathway signal protein n=1 Tax=Streptomyces sp. NPDC053560 TaxID=3365711 RepID=UPI0037D5B5B0
MADAKNQALQDWMDEHEVTAQGLSDLVNKALLELTGRPGKTCERTVFRWLACEIKWPQAATRQALHSVTGRRPEELGFAPRGRNTGTATQQEDPVLRRRFLNVAATGAAVAATSAGARPTVGTGDVNRVRAELRKLWLLDDQQGGDRSLEERANRLVQHTLGLQQNGSATQRIRGRLYGLAASATAMAMWCAVDTGRLADAQRYLEQAVTLAGLSGDGQVQHQTWRYAAMVAGQRGRHVDQMAAAEAAAATWAHRSDPMYASLSHAHIALAASNAGDRRRTLQALDRAADSFDRADDRTRPPSMAFYTGGELAGLTGIAHSRLGDADKAESYAHRCLSALRPDQHRNRAYYTAQLAIAQLNQGDMEQACHTATSVMPPPGAGATGRVPKLLGNFSSALNMRAPGAAITREWNLRSRAV